MANPLLGKFEPVKPFRVLYNVGCLFDIMTGSYEPGMKGESILNGGMAHIESWTGSGNSFKSTIAHFRMLRVLQRYANSYAFMYDTENSATIRRLKTLADTIDPTGVLSASLDCEDPQQLRFMFADASQYNGSEWWDLFKQVCQDRMKAKLEDTPFLNTRTGKCHQQLAPLVGEIDSFSQFQTASVFEKVEKATVGDSEMNPVAMQNANGKAQLLDSLPYLTSKAGFSIMLSAHMGKTIQMDKYSGDKKQLAFVKNDRKMKKTTESFTFLINNLFEITSAAPMLDGKKQPEFPRNSDDDLKGMTDLMEITILPIRTKNGISGYPFPVVVSQRFGVQATLTEYYYMKIYERYGLIGNLVQQKLAIYPEVTFTRNNIRAIADSDPKFRRAAEILSELCVMKNHWPDYAEKFLVDPTELYEGIKRRGYDWDVLLQTRGYWVYDQYTHPVPYLSTDDLVRMYHGTYHPFWMKEKPTPVASTK